MAWRRNHNGAVEARSSSKASTGGGDGGHGGEVDGNNGVDEKRDGGGDEGDNGGTVGGDRPKACAARGAIGPDADEGESLPRFHWQEPTRASSSSQDNEGTNASSDSGEGWA